jgi:HK97 family phage portal protein
MFSNGMMVGGALSHPGVLGTEAIDRLKASLEERYAGTSNAHKWMVLEEGMTAERFSQTSVESQHIENRDHQIEEIARAFGVPRPLLMMDDTSWGSGIEQLGIFFVQYTLQPWFTAWEQAITRTLLGTADKKTHFAKYNERALMRGTLKDQADFFSKALGAGGHSPWMSQNEIRGLSELPESTEKDTDSLKNPMTQQGKPQDEPAKPA